MDKRLPATILSSIGPLMRLIVALAMDRRVPWEAKTALGLAALYVVSPLDGIPDIIPVIGWLDDIAVILLIFDGMLNHLDADIVREHWKGDPADLDRIQTMVRKVASIIPQFVRDRVYKSAFRGKADWAKPKAKVVDAR